MEAMDAVMERYAKLQNGSDVRGIAMEGVAGEAVNLTPVIAADIAAAFAGWLADRLGRPADQLRIGIGHDSRLSAESMKTGAASGLAAKHCRVYDCGLTSTPSMFMATILDGFSYDGSIEITASHLPFNRNGLKFFTKDGGLESSDIRDILGRAAEICKGREASGTDWLQAEPPMEKADLVTAYAAHLRSCICSEVGKGEADRPLAGLHIVIDGSNGVGGFFREVLEPLGADTSGSICMEPDGTFPVHVPNPEAKEAIEAIRNAVLENRADLGVIFDTDGDRAAVVFSDGEEVNRNAIIALMASILAEKHPGSTVVTDSVTSDHLTVFLEQELHMKHHRFKRGYRNVINEAVRLNREGTDSQLAIETSGHGALKENYFLDDGAYMSVKIVARLALCRMRGEKLEDSIRSLGRPAESEERRFAIKAEDFRAYGAAFLKDFRAWAEEQETFHIVEPNYEGIRISFRDEEVQGWLLMRMSLHDPVIPLNLEAEQKGGTDIMMKRLQPFLDRYEDII